MLSIMGKTTDGKSSIGGSAIAAALLGGLLGIPTASMLHCGRLWGAVVLPR